MRNSALTNAAIALALFGLLPACGQSNDTSVAIKSPHGDVGARIFSDVSGQLRYETIWKGKQLSKPGMMAVNIDGVLCGSAVKLGKPSFGELEETYPTSGVKSQAINHAITVTIPFTQANCGAGTLETRTYDDGIAWRLRFDATGRHHINEEASTWVLPDGKVWYGERNNDWKLKSYAGEYISTDVDSFLHASTQGPIQLAPLVIELKGGGYELITEAHLLNYSGMRLEALTDRRLKVNFTEGKSGFDLEGPIQTPWRVTMLANDLNGLVNSDLITNLNPAPDPVLFSDTSYIHSGRSVWRWWSRQTGTPEQEIEFAQYAAALGFEYTLVDDGWKNWPDAWNSLGKVCSAARTQGIGVFAWKDYKDISDPQHQWQQLREFAENAKSAGLAGVKIDFLNAESKDRIDFEHTALVTFARLHMMVDFHGIHKPTGERRTFPNEISTEAVRGVELNKMAEGPITSSHNAALPFTRFVVGPADYTPLSLTWPGDTSWTQQVATAVLFTSPLLVIAEDPELLLKSADVKPALDLIEGIPSTWDETRVLPESRIGALAAMARRKGDIWYIAILNGPTPWQGTIDLSSFSPASSAHAEVLTSPEKRSFHKADMSIVLNTPPLEYRLAPNDGIVIRISPTPQ